MIKQGFAKGTLFVWLFACTQAQAIPQFHQGFYLGGAVGAGSGHVDWDGVSEVSGADNNGASLTIFQSWTPDGDNNDSKLSASAILGYQFVYTPLYLAIEIGGTFSPQYQFILDDTKSFETSFLSPLVYDFVVNADLYDQVSLGGNQFNFDLKPGGVFYNERVLVYGRLGLAINDLTLESAAQWTNIASLFSTPTFLTVNGSSKESKTAYGIRLGVGAETLITENLGITLDYIYTYFGSITTQTQGVADGSSTGNFTQIAGLDAPDVTVSTQSLMLGLLFHW